MADSERTHAITSPANVQSILAVEPQRLYLGGEEEKSESDSKWDGCCGWLSSSRYGVTFAREVFDTEQGEGGDRVERR